MNRNLKRNASGQFASAKPKQPHSKDPVKDFISLIKAEPEKIERTVRKLFSLAANGNLKAIDLILKYGIEEKEELTTEEIHAATDSQLEAIVRGEKDWRKF